MSGFYSYLKIINQQTPYGTKMVKLSNQIFGKPVRPVLKRHERMYKILGGLPVDKDPNIVAYYPRHVETHFLMKNLRSYGLFRDEHQDFTEEMRRLRALRGKERPFKEKKADKKKA